MLDLRYARHLGLNPQLVGQLADLPGTAGLEGLKARAQALAGWRVGPLAAATSLQIRPVAAEVYNESQGAGVQNTLQKGTVPPPGEYEWPVEPFQSKFKDAMIKLEMPRFCRRYPKLTDVLLQQMLALVQASPWLLHLALHSLSPRSCCRRPSCSSTPDLPHSTQAAW